MTQSQFFLFILIGLIAATAMTGGVMGVLAMRTLSSDGASYAGYHQASSAMEL